MAVSVCLEVENLVPPTLRWIISPPPPDILESAINQSLNKAYIVIYKGCVQYYNVNLFFTTKKIRMMLPIDNSLQIFKSVYWDQHFVLGDRILDQFGVLEDQLFPVAADVLELEMVGDEGGSVLRDHLHRLFILPAETALLQWPDKSTTSYDMLRF